MTRSPTYTSSARYVKHMPLMALLARKGARRRTRKLALAA